MVKSTPATTNTAQRPVTRSLVDPPVAKVVTGLTRGGRSVPSQGLRLDLSHDSIEPAIRAAVFWNLHERGDIHLIHQYIVPHVPVVDLGAGLGVTSMHALSMLEPDVELYAVEANPTMVPILRSVLRHQQRAAVIPGALDYESDSQTVDFYPNSNFLRSAVKPDGETTAVPVPRLTMAGLLEERCVTLTTSSWTSRAQRLGF